MFVGETDLAGRMGNFRGAESVEESHPDAMMDGIASRIVDTAIEESLRVAGIPPHVAIEGAVKGNAPEDSTEHFRNGVVLLVGEVSLPEGVPPLDYEGITRQAIRDRGYTDPLSGFSFDTVNVLRNITEQSQQINDGIKDKGKGLGAGDQGINVGAAIAGDGPEYMPMAVTLANGLTQRLTEVKKQRIVKGLLPDGKAQVVLKYYQGRIESVHSVTVATAHDPHMELPYVQELVRKEVICPVFDAFKVKLSPNTQIIVNGAGSWSKYGPPADAGEVGRKLAVAYWAGLAPIGGGTPFGKDPSKIDLTGALICRFGAKFVVENRLAEQARLTLYWTIGQPIPDAITIQTKGNRVSKNEIKQLLARYIAFSVSGAIEQMGLYNVKYEPLAAGGIFGRPEYPWENPPLL